MLEKSLVKHDIKRVIIEWATASISKYKLNTSGCCVGRYQAQAFLRVIQKIYVAAKSA